MTAAKTIKARSGGRNFLDGLGFTSGKITRLGRASLKLCGKELRFFATLRQLDQIELARASARVRENEIAFAVEKICRKTRPVTEWKRDVGCGPHEIITIRL